MLNDYIKWTATVLTLMGAIATSLNIYPLNVALFNIGGALWLWFAIRIKEKSLIVVNAGLLIIYIFGVLKAIV
jgi:drug/metabolite transporter superfamily protein YnfA